MAKRETELSVLKEIRDVVVGKTHTNIIVRVGENFKNLSRFVDNGDGTVTDKKTGLMWVKNPHTDLPDAFKAFSAQCAWRGWSEVDASLHYAVYEFDDAARARAIPGSDALKRLVAEFDRAWGDKVTRSRDIVAAVQTIGA